MVNSIRALSRESTVRDVFTISARCADPRHGVTGPHLLSKGMQELTQIIPRDRLDQTQLIGPLIRTIVRAKKDIHQRRKVTVVETDPSSRMMPMMQLRRADQHPQRADRQTDVRVNEDRPDTTKGQKTSQRCKGKSCLLYTSPSPRDATLSRMPSSA